VNLGVAKDQKLSLNPQQISGACGRLMCCLRHEHDFYVQSRRRFPKEGKRVITRVGEELVVACDIFNDRVTLRSAEGEQRVLALADFQAEVGGVDPTAAAASAVAETSIDASAAEAAAAATMARAAVLEALPLDETRRLLDTSEFQVVMGALALTSDALVSPDEDLEDTDEDEEEDAAEDAPTAASAPAGDAPRRKRRRGKRGGRRRRQQ